MKTIWIIGIGKFGSLAADRLEGIYRNCRFVLVDPAEEHLLKAEGPNRSLKQTDGVSFLLRNLSPGKGPDWIIPALPVHLLAQWVIAKRKPHGIERIQIPKAAKIKLPNCFEGENGDVYVSHADFICPDDCPEPSTTCSVTGKKREKNMFDLLYDIELPGFRSIVVRSYQLAPGVGGYRPVQLFSALQEIAKNMNPILLSTACRCHGVVTGMKHKKLKKPPYIYIRFLLSHFSNTFARA